MHAIKDLPPIDATLQKEPIAFDFQPYLPPGIYLTGTPTVTCVNAESTEVTDATPSARLVGAPTIDTVDPPDGAGIANTAVLQFVGDCIAGVTYLLHAICNRSDTGVASLWVHMKCVQPG